MKIANATMAMVSNHFREDKHTEVENINIWADPPAQSSSADTVSISQLQSIIDEGSEKMATLDTEDEINKDPRLLMIKKLVEMLTGKSIVLLKPADMGSGSQDTVVLTADTTAQSNRQGWGIRYEHHETYSEKEQTTYAAAGIVRTADGREIQFQLKLEMNREFSESSDISFRAGDALLDPLVINFAGNAAQLTDQKFAFDINSDGIKENLPTLTGGSGILVFDKNKDLVVNDGSELFGPKTGNGFQELAALDQTKDGWIDENDSNYNSLYVWIKNGEGADELQSLKEAGVGAIYLPAAETSFDLKNIDNQTEGRIKQTGIYISETGQAGTIQQIDLAV